MNRFVEQRKNDALMSTPKYLRPKVKQIAQPVIQRPFQERVPLQEPKQEKEQEPALFLTPEYSRYPSAIRLSMTPPPQIPAVFYPQKLQEPSQYDQPQSVTYFNKPRSTKAATKAEIMIDGNIVMIRTTNNETLTFNKKLMVGFQASIDEEKLTIFLKSNTLVTQMVYNEDWAKIIEKLHLIITNRSLQSTEKSKKPTFLSKLVQCFQKKQLVTSECQTTEQLPNAPSP